MDYIDTRVTIRINGLSHRGYSAAVEILADVTGNKEIRGWSVFGAYRDIEFDVTLNDLTAIADRGLKFSIPDKNHADIERQERIRQAKVIMRQYRKDHKKE